MRNARWCAVVRGGAHRREVVPGSVRCGFYGGGGGGGYRRNDKVGLVHHAELDHRLLENAEEGDQEAEKDVAVDVREVVYIWQLLGDDKLERDLRGAT